MRSPECGTSDCCAVLYCAVCGYQGPRFLDVFLLTYRSFGISPKELLNLLIARYQSASSADPLNLSGIHAVIKLRYDGYASTLLVFDTNHTSYACVTCIRVFHVLRTWLTRHSRDFINLDPESIPLLHGALSFFEGEPSREFERHALSLKRQILRLESCSRKMFRHAARSSLKASASLAAELTKPLHSSEMDIWKYPPAEFARQLALLDFGDFFQHIESCELLDGAWRSPAIDANRAPNVMRAMQWFNTVRIASSTPRRRTHMLSLLT